MQRDSRRNRRDYFSKRLKITVALKSNRSYNIGMIRRNKMEFTYSDDCFSDLHKEVYGFRPRGSLMDDWNDRTPRQKQELWNALCDELEVNTKREREQELEDVAQVEKNIKAYIALGARDRKDALRWMTQNETFYSGQCVESWVWDQGILLRLWSKSFYRW